MKIATIIVFVFTTFYGMSQIGINNNTPSANSELQISTKSNNPRGLLIPSIKTSVRTTTLQNKLGTVDLGMLIYDTDLKNVYQWNGTTWKQLGGDDLGGHELSKNVETGSFYISADGDNEGIKIDDEGNVFLSKGLSLKYGKKITQIKNSSVLTLSDTTVLTEKAVKMYVDSKAKAPVAFSAESRVGQVMKKTAGGTIWTTVSFEKELYDIGSGFSDDKYVVSVKGLYHLDTHIELSNVGNIGLGDKKMIVGVFVNGTLRKRGVTVFPFSVNGSYKSVGCSVSADLFLNETDKVTVRVFQNTSVDQLTKKTAGEVIFNMHLISKL